MDHAQVGQVAKSIPGDLDYARAKGRLPAGEEFRQWKALIAHPGNFIPGAAVLLGILMKWVAGLLGHSIYSIHRKAISWVNYNLVRVLEISRRRRA